MCGIKRRSEYPDFCSYIQNFDSLCCSETKTDDIDIISIDGYECFIQSRKQRYIRRSGGICIFIKKALYRFLKVIETASDYVFWVNISSVLTNLDEDLLLGVMYIPPSQSKYLNEDEIMNLEMEITSHCSQYKYII